MPWYAFVCDVCGQEVQLRASAVQRDAAPPHQLYGGCREGRLRHVSAARGSGPLARGAPRAAVHAGAASAEEVLPPAELAHRLLPALPSLSMRLQLAEVVGRCGAVAAPYADAFGDELAAEVAAAPGEVLAREPRLLDLLLLARRHGRLDTRDVERLAADEAVVARLLGSALGWPAARSPDPNDAPRFAWAALRSLAGAPLLCARIVELAARSAGIADAWDRLAVDAAAAELEAEGEDALAAR
jgi:hypothetical protein